MGDDEDDLEMDEWLKLTDAQQDAILDREMKAHTQWFDALPLAQQQRHCIRGALRNCVKWRALMARLPAMDFMRDQLKQRQRRLLVLRIWRQTGIYPGEA